MNIKDWLSEHPAISYCFIAKTCRIKPGILRKDRGIPSKYNEIIIKLLEQYGFNKEVILPTGPSLEKPETETKKYKPIKIYIVQPTIPFTRESTTCIKEEDGTYTQVELPDGTEFIF